MHRCYHRLVNCYVMNGGRSRRMGSAKWKLKLEGRTFLDRVLAAAIPVFGEVAIVATSDWEAGTTVRVIREGTHDKASPLYGLREACRDSPEERFWVLGVDFPFVTSDVLRFLTSRFAQSAAEMLIPVDDGRRQMLCAGYRRSLEGTVEAMLLAEDFRLQNLLLKHTFEIISDEEIDARFSCGLLRNVNYSSEYEALRRIHG